jgi:hypothetical protein
LFPLSAHKSENNCKIRSEDLAINYNKCENDMTTKAALFENFYLSNLVMTQERNVIVITSCTNRKRKTGSVLALEGVETSGSLRDLARQWKHQVRAAGKDKLQAAIDLYSGRSIVEARRTAETLAAPLHIVSAGHGLVRSDERIPSYNITASPAPDNTLHHCLVRLGKNPADWWRALVQEFGKQRSFASLVSESGTAIILLAAPSAYLTLLAEDLAKLSDSDVKRLRIITSPFGASNLPARLQPTVMPYDERLEGLVDYAGTRSDFPQRALRHFVAVLSGQKLALEASRERVRQAMEALQKPVLPERQRKSNEEILALMRQNWKRFNGSANGLLRYLRDEALVACEQSRFRSLRLQLLSELNTEVGAHG